MKNTGQGELEVAKERIRKIDQLGLGSFSKQEFLTIMLGDVPGDTILADYPEDILVLVKSY